PPGPDAPPAPPPGPPPARLPGHASLDHLWGPAPPRDESAGPHRPDQRGGGPLPAPAPWRAGPPGPQEAGPHPRRRRPPDPWPRCGQARPGIGYDYLHSAVDDRSPVAFSQLLPDQTGATSARFLVEAAAFFGEHGVVIQRVLTDNAKAYAESVVFAETAAVVGIRRKRSCT